MILETKIARTILLALAIILAGCAVAIVVTGWDGNSSKATEQTPDQTIETTITSEITAISSDTEDLAGQPKTTVPSEPRFASPTPEPSTNAAQQEEYIADGVYIEVTPAETYPGEEIQVNVKASFNNYGISGSEIILSFNPTVLQITNLSIDGVLGSNPLIGMEERDNERGLLRYALARRGPTEVPASDEQLASMTFKVNDSTPSGLYAFKLTDVQLTDESFSEIAGFRQKDGVVTVR